MWQREKLQVSGTKFRWDRGWVYYWAEPILDEALAPEGWPEVDDATKREYHNSKKEGWSSFILELKTPIAFHTDIRNIIETEKLRIYPPFQLNTKDSNSGLFNETKIPTGTYEALDSIEIPNYAIKATSIDMKIGNAVPCYGLRIDVHNDISHDVAIDFFLQIVRQYSKQWWVGTSQNPFDIGLRMNFQINKDNSPRFLLQHKGAGQVPAPWYGIAATQNLIGLETPVDQKIWDEVGNCMRIGYGKEDVLQYFLTATAAFMAHEDNQTILNLAFMFEVAENKVRIIQDKNTISKNRDILRTPLIANKLQTEIFRKLITDRDNIAHGRRAYHAKNDPKILIEYLETSADFINKYLEICTEIGWSKALKVAL